MRLCRCNEGSGDEIIVDWIGPKSKNKCYYKRREGENKEKKSDIKTEAEIKIIHP